jgi:hypothetical protein
MPLVAIARILAVAWVALSVWVYFLMLNGFTPQQALILLLWVAAPLPLAYWIGSRLAATSRAWVAMVVGLALAFVLAPGSTGTRSWVQAAARKAYRDWSSCMAPCTRPSSSPSRSWRRGC